MEEKKQSIEEFLDDEATGHGSFRLLVLDPKTGKITDSMEGLPRKGYCMRCCYNDDNGDHRYRLINNICPHCNRDYTNFDWETALAAYYNEDED